MPCLCIYCQLPTYAVACSRTPELDTDPDDLGTLPLAVMPQNICRRLTCFHRQLTCFHRQRLNRPSSADLTAPVFVCSRFSDGGRLNWTPGTGGRLWGRSRYIQHRLCHVWHIWLSLRILRLLCARGTQRYCVSYNFTVTQQRALSRPRTNRH